MTLLAYDTGTKVIYEAVQRLDRVHAGTNLVALSTHDGYHVAVLRFEGYSSYKYFCGKAQLEPVGHDVFMGNAPMDPVRYAEPSPALLTDAERRLRVEREGHAWGEDWQAIKMSDVVRNALREARFIDVLMDNGAFRKDQHPSVLRSSEHTFDRVVKFALSPRKDLA